LGLKILVLEMGKIRLPDTGISILLEGITHQPPKPPFRLRLSYQNFLDFSKSLENSKNLLDYREYSKYCKYYINFRFCSIKVSKIQVEQKGDLGGWWVIPSSTWTLVLGIEQDSALWYRRWKGSRNGSLILAYLLR
jgi:hypothetical protein